MSRNKSLPALLSLAGLLLLLIVGHAFPRVTEPIKSVLRPIYSFGFDKGSYVTESSESAGILKERIDALEKEIDFLRRDAAISGDLARPKILARVLYRDADPSRQVLHVAIPEGSAVQVGDPVVSPGDILIGDVMAVNNRLAQVRLIYDPEFKIAARFNETEGVLQGVGVNMLSMTLIPANDVPAIGELVYTSDKEATFPRDLLIGTITKVSSDSGDPFATLDVLPATSLQNLEAVAILIGDES